MSSSCRAILRSIRSGLFDRNSSAGAPEGLPGSIFVARIGLASACVFVQLCFSTSLGS